MSRLETYIPTVDEFYGLPHEPHCQTIRLGDQYCCTCESNRVRRLIGIKRSAAAYDKEVVESLGSLECSIWRDYVIENGGLTNLPR